MLLRTSSGRCLDWCFLRSVRDQLPSSETAILSMPFFTAPRPGVHGVICPSALGRGRRSTTDFRTGRREASGRRSSRRCSSRSTNRGAFSTVPWSELIRTHRAEKGGPMQCSGPLSRRFFNEAPRHHGHERPAALHHRDARPAARRDDGRVAAGARLWSRGPRRLGVRRGSSRHGGA